MTAKKTDDRMSLGEHSELLTGYDEDKIKARFGAAVYGSEDEPGLKGLPWLRALVYADKMHQGIADAAAHDAAMSMSVKTLNDYFADEPEEVDEREPETDAGKSSAAEGSAG